MINKHYLNKKKHLKKIYAESTFDVPCWKVVYGKFVTIARSKSIGNVLLSLCEVSIYGEVNLDTSNYVSNFYALINLYKYIL